MINEINEFKQRGQKLKTIKNIHKLSVDDKHFLVIQESLKFFEDYGFDFSINYFYGVSLRKIGQLENSIKVFEKLVNAYDSSEDKRHFYDSSVLELFKAYFMNDNYQKAYELWEFVYPLLKERGYICVDDYLIILKIKLGLEVKTNTLEQDVLKSQLTNYDSKLSLMHIKQHTIENDENEINYFDDNIDIEKIFKIASENIFSSKKLTFFSRRDNYVFYFPNIGKNGENLLRVVTNKGTNEIITMYPSNDNKDYTEFINNNLYEEYIYSKESKTKRLSQIEKFKNRFSK